MILVWATVELAIASPDPTFWLTTTINTGNTGTLGQFAGHHKPSVFPQSLGPIPVLTTTSIFQSMGARETNIHIIPSYGTYRRKQFCLYRAQIGYVAAS